MRFVKPAETVANTELEGCKAVQTSFRHANLTSKQLPAQNERYYTSHAILLCVKSTQCHHSHKKLPTLYIYTIFHHIGYRLLDPNSKCYLPDIREV